MGLFKELLLLPVAPVRFTVWVAEQVTDEADRREAGPGGVAGRLQRLEEARERGELDEAEAERREGELIEEVARPVAQPPEEEADGG